MSGTNETTDRQLMKRGIERVERLLAVRGFEERMRRSEWSASLQVESESQRTVDLARAEVDALQGELRDALSKPRLEASTWVDFNSAIDAALSAVDRALVVLDRARRDRVAKESTWRAARRRALALERLRDRRKERLHTVELRAERLEADAIALAQHVRRANRNDAPDQSDEPRGHEMIVAVSP